MSDALVRLSKVSKSFGYYQVLFDVSFELRPGEVFGYIGPNGAGKTTTLKILAGLMPKYDGELVIDGRVVTKDRSDVHKEIGFLPQSAGFQSWRTVDNTLRTLGTLSGLDAKTLDERATVLLERFELAAVRHKKVKELSGGMTQKLGLIQALLHNPKLIVLDEPLSGLDPVSRRVVKDIVRERRDAGATVIFSSHILGDVQNVADRIGILSQGRLVTLGTVDEIKTQFGMPIDIGVDMSRVPADVGYLENIAGVQGVQREGPERWLIRVDREADRDALIHHVVEQTLAAGGRLRRVGIVEANLDDLYASYIKAHSIPTDAPVSH